VAGPARPHVRARLEIRGQAAREVKGGQTVQRGS
jgi:hypothetical protein